MRRTRTHTAMLALAAVAFFGCTDDGGGGPGFVQHMDAALPDTVADAADAGVGDSGSDAPTGPVYVEPDPVLADNFQLLIEEYLAFTGETNMSLTVLMPGEVRWRGVAGTKDLATGEAMEPGAAFRVGSSTKPVISTLVLLLAEAGFLDLDDPLGMYVPGYERWADITIRQLLGMRSGIADYMIDQSLWMGIVQHPEEPMSTDRLLSYVSEQPLQFEPGTQCLYSNTNYLLMGLVIEAATGNRTENELRRRIVEPLQLEHTYLDVAGDPDARLAHGYMDPRPAFVALGIPPQLVDLVPAELFIDDNILDCTYLFHPSVAGTAGALVTTTEDMARFMRALVGGELVSEDSLVAMMEFPPCTILGDPADYGLGLSRTTTPDGDGFGHGGLIYGYSANTMHVPDVGLTYSHMHGAYPAQSWALISEVHRLYDAPPPTVPDACEPPEGFFLSEDVDHLAVRVRGVLNAADAATPLGAIANLSAYLDTLRYPVYGTYTVASVKPQLYQRRAEVLSLGPPRSYGWSHTFGMLSLDTGTITARLEDGVYESAENPYTVVHMMADVAVDPTTGAMDHYCVAAVPDVAKKTRLSFCDADELSWEEGALLRMFGTVPLTTDATAIESYMAPLELGRCNCLVAPDQWEPCEPDRRKRAISSPPSLSRYPRPAGDMRGYPQLRGLVPAGY